MEKILKLIESVDPADTAKLDEIDALVLYYINCPDIKHTGSPITFELVSFDPVQYTRSRDALKALRDGNQIMLSDFQYAEENYCFSVLPFMSDEEIEFQGVAKTEELAELHAIIQAIAYERSEK